MVGTSANNADFDPIFRVPLEKQNDFFLSENRGREPYTSKTIENVNIFSSVEVIDSTLTINFESIYGERQ